MMTISGKIPIIINPLFWVLAAVISFINTKTEFLDTNHTSMFLIAGAIWMFVIFFSVLIHEYGHALTAVAFGQKAEISLVAFGGVTRRTGPRLKLWKEFIIVFNGPLFGFGLFVLAKVLLSLPISHSFPPTLIYGLTITMLANLFWTLLNLLPIIPLDGGYLLSIILESLFGLKGAKIAHLASAFFSIAISIFCFAKGEIFLGSIFLILAFDSYRRWQSNPPELEIKHTLEVQPLISAAQNEYKRGNPKKAISLYQEIREVTKKGTIYNVATQNIATILYATGHYQEAYEMLKPLRDNLEENEMILLQKLAYHNGDLKAAISYGDLCYKSFPSYDPALLNAICYSVLGDVRPAVGWLQCAIREGMPNPRAVLDKEEFDSIRQLPPFKELVKKIRDI